MKLRELDAKMRAFETGNDSAIPLGQYVIARLDGRGFGRLTRDVLKFDGPADPRLRDHMTATTQELMHGGFQVLYAYTQGDEISLLFHRDDTSFGRRRRKYNSVLAGIASAAFSLRVSALACFDCRISELPDEGLVIEYFRWRARDGERNALNSYCTWAMENAGASRQESSTRLHGLNAKAKKKLLACEHGIDFETLPSWQKRGLGLYWVPYEKQFVDPQTGAEKSFSRQRIHIDPEQPSQPDYGRFLGDLMRAAQSK